MGRPEGIDSIGKYSLMYATSGPDGHKVRSRGLGKESSVGPMWARPENKEFNTKYATASREWLGADQSAAELEVGNS